MRFSAVVLAAGTSSRMQGRHKLLLPVGGEPVVRRTARAVLDAGPAEVVVVTGFNGEAVARALDDLPLRLVSNPRFEEGKMTSAVAGVSALAAPADAVMVCLADMALLDAADYRELIVACAGIAPRSILVPWRRGDADAGRAQPARRGNPVVFLARHIPEVIAGTRNMGCRKLIESHPDEVHLYEAAHDRFFVDLDTPDDYARLLEHLGVPAQRAASIETLCVSSALCKEPLTQDSRP